MTEKYKRIEKPLDSLPANEIRVKRKVGIGRYLKRAHDLFNETENSTGVVIIKGVSNAVESAVKLAELIKHRVKGLYTINKITNITIDDEYEPLEEGLDHLKFTRIVTMLEITLSKAPLDEHDIGYQPPIDEKEVQDYSDRDQE
jgi:DNA-binding protein